MKVLLIDDHPLIQLALQSVIEGLEEGLNVIFASTARAGRTMLAEDPSIDLVLLDLQLGDADGFDVLSEFRRGYPALPVVVVSASDRTSDVIRSIDLGAMGFIPKRASNETICQALRLIMSGGIYVPPMSMGSGNRTVIGSNDGFSRYSGLTHGYQDIPVHTPQELATLGLTPRQSDVLALLLQGQTNKTIAREMGLSTETVKDHVAAVLRTLNVNSRTQAVLAVAQLTQQAEGSGSSGSGASWRKS